MELGGNGVEQIGSTTRHNQFTRRIVYHLRNLHFKAIGRLLDLYPTPSPVPVSPLLRHSNNKAIPHLRLIAINFKEDGRKMVNGRQEQYLHVPVLNVYKIGNMMENRTIGTRLASRRGGDERNAA